MYRLSQEGPGDISFIAGGTISYSVMSERSERGTKYDIVTRAIKLILPSLECDNLFITYLCLYQSDSRAKIRFYFLIINHLISFPNECKNVVKNPVKSAKTLQKQAKNNLSFYSCRYLSVIGRFYVTLIKAQVCDKYLYNHPLRAHSLQFTLSEGQR